MTEVTLTVLHGSDRGKVFRDIAPPVTIGREEGNTIQLNDERISRCHLKIQFDNDRLVLTDLDSTNGTKVNGQESHLRILRHGDLVSVGRSMLLVGTEEQIAARVAALQAASDKNIGATMTQDLSAGEGSSGLEFEVGERNTDREAAGTLGMIETPEIPDRLSPSQAAQMCEVLEFLHQRLQKLIDHAQIDERTQEVVIDYAAWQRMIDLQSKIGTMIRKAADPDWMD
ncbi:FHA domain-containing protein FhaA [Rosistilla ulvae]|uniref:FHA domain-containing protein FhaA n=1 Tax=Rosistilla ulvae TaxID=1930277 RepID=A0A517LXK5_9BACT|nr:FHA domain-containing protein [Rosistilla ulvae]QDS87332.1 FHA domain-containing protein FhaA [Rosistilla ulvae]